MTANFGLMAAWTPRQPVCRPSDEDLSLHPSEQKSFVGDPESLHPSEQKSFVGDPESLHPSEQKSFVGDPEFVGTAAAAPCVSALDDCYFLSSMAMTCPSTVLSELSA
jgi:hypothetical protein